MAPKKASVDGGVTKRKRKDPNAPKRALSAFFFFSGDKRDALKAENPGISFGQVGKRLGEMWKELSDKDKKPYEEMAENDKKRYEAEMAAYKKR